MCEADPFVCDQDHIHPTGQFITPRIDWCVNRCKIAFTQPPTSDQRRQCLGDDLMASSAVLSQILYEWVVHFHLTQ